MKRILAILLCFILCSSLCLCGTYEGQKSYDEHTNLISIVGHKNLYYDPDTCIVYIIFNEAQGYTGYGYMSAYYASNGLPYTYDIRTNSLVEIEDKR